MLRIKSDSAAMRRRFLGFLWAKLRIIWPILSALVLLQLLLGMFAGFIESWSIGESVYFTFVTGLTVGYGDFVPKHLLSRAAAVLIGVDGIVIMGLVAAVSVRALEETAAKQDE